MPSLAPGWDPTVRALTPSEGFLLSRIDGRTSWDLLRQIGGIAPEDVDRCLEQWVSEGFVLLVEGRDGIGRADAPPKPAESTSPRGILESQLDDSLEIDVERQRRILEFESGLDRPYHDLLGVARDVDQRGLKRAYFALSKEFHPDRYFRREIGGFNRKLERIFRKIVEAYELLMDPTSRAEIERSLSARPRARPASATSNPEDARRSRKRAALERLRRQFRIPEEILSERRFKARQFHDAAMVSVHRENWIEAASSIRLAIAFDPWNDEYKDAFAEVQANVHKVRAAELFEQAKASWDDRAIGEALRLYEEALHYQPFDPEVNDRAAGAALEAGELERAREYAERACELCPDTAAYHFTLGRVLRKEGVRDKAKAAFETVVRLDPNNERARDELARFRKSGRPGRTRGGIK